MLRAGALGDALLSFPVLHGLRAGFPDASIAFASRTEARFLAREAGLADEALDLGSPLFMPLFATSAERSSELAAAIERFDLVVSLLSDPAGSLAERLRALGARSVLSFRSLGEGEAAARQLFRVLAPLGIDRFPDDAPIVRMRGAPPPDLPERFIIIHPGSGSSAKNWPAARFAEIGAEALARGHAVLIPRGEADAGAAGRLDELLGNRGRVIERGLVELARIIARASCAIGNDSGVTHLAALLGVPTVAVFGPTDPVVWRPVGPRVFTVGGGGAFPTAAEVLAIMTVAMG